MNKYENIEKVKQLDFDRLDMLVSERRDLRQVGDDDDLSSSRETGQAPAHLNCSTAADPGINLIEDKCRHRISPSEHDFQGEHDPRQFTP